MKTLSRQDHKASIELLLLAAIWGASFMFMRVGVAEFGPILFTILRTGIAAIFAYVWLKDKLSLSASFGLFIGFIGVYLLVSENLHFSATLTGQLVEKNVLLPTLAAMLAALCYGISANYTKKHLSTIKPLALAAGSQIAATAMLLPLSLFFMPQTLPSAKAIWSVLLIGIICTGVAYILFFRLIAQLGPAKAISVTYLIPAFGILWGALFLGETISSIMLIGSGVILLGVALSTGVLQRK